MPRGATLSRDPGRAPAFRAGAGVSAAREAQLSSAWRRRRTMPIGDCLTSRPAGLGLNTLPRTPQGLAQLERWTTGAGTTNSRSGRSGRDLVDPSAGCPHGLRPICSARLKPWAAHERRGDRVEGALWQGHAGELEWGRAVASPAAERAARAGWGLSAASIHWGKRGAAAKPLALTERDLRLLALLHDVNYLSSSQLALLG